MAHVTRVWHISSITNDVPAMDRWFDDLFSSQRWMENEFSPSELRDASMNIVSDLNFESMTVSRVPGAEKSPIGAFYARHGARYHSLAFFLDDPISVYEALRERNLTMMSGNGRPLTEPPVAGGPMYTHPKQTFGMLELVPDPSTTPHKWRGERDFRWRPDFSTAFWRDEHPLGIERSSHLTLLVQDLASAVDFYQDVLGGKPLHEEEGAAFLTLGDEVVVELATATDPRRQRDLVRYGEGLHTVTFKVKDLGKAIDFLTAKGMRFETLDQDMVTINRSDSFGSIFAFTDRMIPADRRG